MELRIHFVSIAEESVAVAATIMYCAPVYVYILYFIFKLEKSNLFKWDVMAIHRQLFISGLEI